jgi:hypothetical protein
LESIELNQNLVQYYCLGREGLITSLPFPNNTMSLFYFPRHTESRVSEGWKLNETEKANNNIALRSLRSFHNRVRLCCYHNMTFRSEDHYAIYSIHKKFITFKMVSCLCPRH